MSKRSVAIREETAAQLAALVEHLRVEIHQRRAEIELPPAAELTFEDFLGTLREIGLEPAAFFVGLDWKGRTEALG